MTRSGFSMTFCLDMLITTQSLTKGELGGVSKDETFARVSFYYSEERNKKGRGILRRGSS